MDTATDDATIMRKRRVSAKGVFPTASWSEWCVRIVLLLLVATLGYYSTTFSLAQVMAKRDPAVAYMLAPYDGRIVALYASSLAGPEADKAQRVHADQLARQALVEDPTAVAAVATLGIDAEVRKDPGLARKLFAYAQTLTRRDLRTQLWSIEDAVGRGNVPQALKWYDITLRTGPEMGALLFPVLASASEDPSIQAELVRTLARRPPWSEHFLNFVPGNASDPRTTAILFRNLLRAGAAVPERARAVTVDALIAKRHYDEAWNYYLSLRPGADRRSLRDPHFQSLPAIPTQLDWVALNDDGMTTAIEDGGFGFEAPSGGGGPMLRQNLLLPPGIYRFGGQSGELEPAEGALPYWTVSCQGGQELARIELSSSNKGRGQFSGTIVVPRDCPVQTLTLVARPTDSVGGLSGRIYQAQLMPARARP
ncbi:hypothetical protein [Sphingomonas sp. S2-65]|uniref:hypothetical protein n=1 Tax=Sphingomonas sp. S2-65 TaxID=2903960 RepID=UPI001F33709E|nr:hypothetical protein [Sphingomonas sp. S2-65]UYY56941.1 hypothetical protein LZ586_09550 [Sphingomonas sp. S2-65]